MLSERFKIARRLLGHTQQEAAEISGLTQRDVSQLETGRKEFIPTQYIQYLNNMGININSIYNKNVQVSKKKQPKEQPNEQPNAKINKDLPLNKSEYLQNQQLHLVKEDHSIYYNISLAEKERIIEALREVIRGKDAQLKDKQRLIDLLSGGNK